MITIAIVESRSGCSCCCGDVRLPLPLSDRVPVALGGKNVLTMLLIADVLTLLLMIKDCCRSAFCCCAVCISRFLLTLPLSDRVPVLVALGGKDVLAMLLIADVSPLLILIMDCFEERNKQIQRVR